MSNHRSNIGSQVALLLSNHFNGACKIEHFRAQPIEKGNGDDNLKLLSSKKFRLEREAYWMKELRTIFPYGLNERCKVKILQRKKIFMMLRPLCSIKFLFQERNVVLVKIVGV